jgi:aminocarboxymuconate-semialdehyde decarboxylase
MTDATKPAKWKFRGSGQAVAAHRPSWFAIEVTVGSLVDVHSHFMPRELPDLGIRTGDSRWPSLRVGDEKARIVRGAATFRVVARSCWDPVSRLEAVEAAGLGIQVISPVPISLVYWAEPGLATAFARAQNERLAETAAASGGRLLAMGSVPLQDVDAAIEEAERITGVLGMAGVEIGTHVEGRELDDPTIRPFFAAAESMGLPIFVHPIDGAGSIRRQGPLYEFGIGMLTDTALAAAALVFGGVLDEHPGLRIALAHGCGTFPWTYPRLLKAASLAPAYPAAASVDELVRRLWVDSLVFDPMHLPLLFERFGAGHVMLGSDFPFYPPSWGPPETVVAEAVRLGVCSKFDASGVLSRNAIEFLEPAKEKAWPRSS